MYYLNEPILHSYLHQARVHEDDAWVHKTIKCLEFKKIKKCRRLLARFAFSFFFKFWPKSGARKLFDVFEFHPVAGGGLMHQ